jgi:hypothetical protein
MIKSFHDFNFSFNTLSSVWFQQFKLLINLNSYLLIRKLMQSYSHNSIRSLTDSFPNNVILQVIIRASFSTELQIKELIIKVLLLIWIIINLLLIRVILIFTQYILLSYFTIVIQELVYHLVINLLL